MWLDVVALKQVIQLSGTAILEKGPYDSALYRWTSDGRALIGTSDAEREVGSLRNRLAFG